MIYSKPIPVAAINAVKAIAAPVAPVAPVAPLAVKSENFVPPIVQATTEAMVNDTVPATTVENTSEQKAGDVVQE